MSHSSFSLPPDFADISKMDDYKVKRLAKKFATVSIKQLVPKLCNMNSCCNSSLFRTRTRPLILGELEVNIT